MLPFSFYMFMLITTGFLLFIGLKLEAKHHIKLPKEKPTNPPKRK